MSKRNSEAKIITLGLIVAVIYAIVSAIVKAIKLFFEFLGNLFRTIVEFISEVVSSPLFWMVVLTICGVGLALRQYLLYMKRKKLLQEKLLKEEEKRIREEEEIIIQEKKRRIREERERLRRKEVAEKQAEQIKLAKERERQEALQREEEKKRKLEQNEREERIQRAIEENEISDHPESYLIKKEDYKRGNPIDNGYKKLWFLTLMGVYDNKCALCQNHMKGIEIDHFVLSKNTGGNFILKHRDGYWVNNAIPLCTPCNRSKGDRDYKFFFTKPQLAFILERNAFMTKKINDWAQKR